MPSAAPRSVASSMTRQNLGLQIRLVIMSVSPRSWKWLHAAFLLGSAAKYSSPIGEPATGSMPRQESCLGTNLDRRRDKNVSVAGRLCLFELQSRVKLRYCEAEGYSGELPPPATDRSHGQRSKRRHRYHSRWKQRLKLYNFSTYDFNLGGEEHLRWLRWSRVLVAVLSGKHAMARLQPC